MQESLEERCIDPALPEDDIFDTLHATTSEDRAQFPRRLIKILNTQSLPDILSRINEIVTTILNLSEDEDLEIRTYMVGEFANIFYECQKHVSQELDCYLGDLLLSILLKYLREESQEIKREAFINLMRIINRLTTNKQRIETKILPSILELSKNADIMSNREAHIISIKIMARIAFIFGAERTEQLILQPFLEYCTHQIDQFRRACASVFPAFCYAMGVEYTETKLLGHFIELCNDNFWGVRKACAEVISMISLLVSPQSRRDKLSPIVLNLANDDSKWVSSTILKNLGQFIATFAEPCVLGIVFRDLEELEIINPIDEDFRIYATPELMKNYEYYLHKFFETGTPQPINNYQRRYKNVLSSEQVAQRIVDTKFKLFEQVNYDVFVRKRVFSYSDYSNSFEKTMLAGQDLSSTEPQILNNIALLIDNYTMNQPGSTTKLEDSMGNDFSSLENELDSLNTTTTTTLNTTPTTTTTIIEEASATTTSDHCLESCSVSADSVKKKNRRFTGPSDLSHIIRQAIDGAQEKTKRTLPLVRQSSRDDVTKPAPVLATPENPDNFKDIMNVVIDSFSNLLDSQRGVNIFSTKDDETLPAAGSDDGFLKTIDKISDEETSGLFETKTSSKEDFAHNDAINSSIDDDAFMEFNSHKYWYIHPELPSDSDILLKKTCKLSVVSEESVLFGKVSCHKLPTDYDQDVVPAEILKAFVKMVLSGEDEEINLFCAYNFPAVALTIGRSNWHLIKALLQYLCDDLDWKVRKTIASYIDLLAMILGREIASNDLLPIYVAFFKDLDEVKIKAIKNAASFLKVIDHQKHEEVLSRIGDCLRVDSKTNWRIKEDLAKQVLLLIKMYNFVNKQESFLYITSLMALFLEDKISCVREIAAEAMVEIIKIANISEKEGIMDLFLVKEFAQSKSWRKRQTFLNIYLKLLKCDQPPTDILCLVFPSIMKLSIDSVPNVRLLVAKCLNVLTKLNGTILYLKDFPEHDRIGEVIGCLQQDQDRDVRDVLNCLENPSLSEFQPSREPDIMDTLYKLASEFPESMVEPERPTKEYLARVNAGLQYDDDSENLLDCVEVISLSNYRESHT